MAPMSISLLISEHVGDLVTAAIAALPLVLALTILFLAISYKK
jgi:hypothetical protein